MPKLIDPAPRDWNLDAFIIKSLREGVPEIATDALVRGLDSPALRVLAGQARWDVRDSSELFRVVLDELGIELPDPDRAQWNLARRTAGEIVAGRMGHAPSRDPDADHPVRRGVDWPAW